ncbi:MAG: potassium channel family protein, partial [Rudaea sp.]
MNLIAIVAGLLLVGANLWDGFETVVLPRRVSRQVRLARLFFRATSRFWYGLARRVKDRGRREDFLGYYGPLALLLLLAAWAAGVILGFALIDWGFGSNIATPEKTVNFADNLYLSATTFFTVGLGDVTPVGWPSRIMTAIEGGTGFGFLALVIGYVPVLYQSFSRRETRISILDEWAGSPPTAAELLRRVAIYQNIDGLDPFLREWENWSAELLETHLSYPVLAFFRSQHENQSWLGALTTILDTCSLIIVGVDDVKSHAARLTFAMARHAVVDLSQVFGVRPQYPEMDRLLPAELAQLREGLA